jgi:hypothetical protein
MRFSSHKPASPSRGEALLSVRNCLRLSLFLILAIIVPQFVLGSQFARAVVGSGPGMQFAAADFDGDHLPDLATVQGGHSDRDATDYWVGLRLSNSGRNYFRLVAPQGGLFVEARDVNGDNAVDLVFATAWLGQPVAVLLNDGHGNFSRSDPANFPAAFVRAKSDWNGISEKPSDSSAIAGSSPVGDFEASTDVARFCPRGDVVRTNRANFSPSVRLGSYAGRAPPSVVLV